LVFGKVLHKALGAGHGWNALERWEQESVALL